MIRFLFPCIFLPCLAVMAHAADPSEITIEKRPFVIRHSITATVLPEDYTLLELKGAAWADFEITRLTAHGSRVSKGEVLVAFETEKIDRKLHDTRQALEARGHEVAQAALELRHLEQTTPHRLESMKRAAAEAQEENTHFTEIRRAASAETVDQKLRRAEISLENEREELRQLEKMYAADDLTEETEEIILHRQRDQVKAAEFELRMRRLDRTRTHEVLLPREAVSLAEAARDAALALAKFEEEAPRAIARKKLELAALNTAMEREKDHLAKLESDRGQFELTAPADGWFYHGPFENGRWNPGDAAKSLVVRGPLAPRRSFATFIASTARLKLLAALDGGIARQLDEGVSGAAWFSGREDAEFPVKLKRVASAPEPDGRFTSEWAAEWPVAPAVAPAAQVGMNLVAYENPDAIVLPAKALRFGSGGWTVAVKLADGKTERRPVKRGRVFNDECEILSGLEPGQVVVP